MIPTWQAWLDQAGAAIRQDRVIHFGDPAAELRAAAGEDIVCDLSQHGLLIAKGDDVTAFLQGQFTIDVGRLTPDHSRLAGYCSPKGRLLACLRVFRHDDDWYLRQPAELTEALHRRLGLFVLRAAVTLRDIGTERVGIGLSGPNTPRLLAAMPGSTPGAVDAVIHKDEFSLIRIPGVQPRFELYGPVDAMQPVWQHLAGQARPAGSDAWTLTGIRAGVPEVHPATQDAFVPQMANLDLLGGIDFDKGCYVGQEIIARTRYLGRLKRRMYRVHIDGDRRPEAGTELFAPELRGEQPVGQIVEAVPDPDGGFEALAVVVIECAQEGLIRCGGPEGPGIRFETLPYEIPAAAAQ